MSVTHCNTHAHTQRTSPHPGPTLTQVKLTSRSNSHSGGLAHIRAVLLTSRSSSRWVLRVVCWSGPVTEPPRKGLTTVFISLWDRLLYLAWAGGGWGPLIGWCLSGRSGLSQGREPGERGLSRSGWELRPPDLRSVVVLLRSHGSG
ncbi:unnamed protein product [Boreogadus saida]